MKQIKDSTRKISVRVSESKLEYLLRNSRISNISELINTLIDEKIKGSVIDSQGIMRSPIVGIGAKNRLAKKIIELMPEHDMYIEPFGNTAGILIQKEKVLYEVYNDINSEVVNFFMVLRDKPIELYERCRSLPYSEELYHKYRLGKRPEDLIDRAVRFFYLNRGSFLGTEGSGFKLGTLGRNASKEYRDALDRFYAVSSRFEGVEITNRDCRKIIRRYSNNENALMLCDVPYYGCKNYYQNSFTIKDHREVADLLKDVKGKVMVCHSRNYQIHKLYTERGFKFDIIRTKYCSNKATVNKEGKNIKLEIPLYIYRNFKRDFEIM